MRKAVGLKDWTSGWLWGESGGGVSKRCNGSREPKTKTRNKGQIEEDEEDTTGFN